jgi:hypothetical protein
MTIFHNMTHEMLLIHVTSAPAEASVLLLALQKIIALTFSLTKALTLAYMEPQSDGLRQARTVDEQRTFTRGFQIMFVSQKQMSCHTHLFRVNATVCNSLSHIYLHFRLSKRLKSSFRKVSFGGTWKFPKTVLVCFSCGEKTRNKWTLALLVDRA